MTSPPYPAHWEADVLLRDGSVAHLRPITPDDADGLVEFYEKVSDRSRYYRFFSPHPVLTPKEVERFTNVDHRDRVALVVTMAERIVAVGRYESIAPGTAEVAFLVQDKHQGRGMGQLLLEHLAQAGRERGLGRFQAEILAENTAMLQVFREQGYRIAGEFESGILSLEFPIAATDTAIGIVEAREHRAEAASIDAFFNPRSIAVVGASRRSQTIGALLVRNLVLGGFSGSVYAVNPSAPAVSGVPAFPSVTAVPGDVDLAIVAVPADAVPDVVIDCANKGVRGLIVISAGFAETGSDGRKRQRRLVGLARSYGLRLIGPNCLGVINTAEEVNLNASLSPVMPAPGRAAFFCQSGALGTAILQKLKGRGLGISSFVSAGNRADVSGNDLLQYWEEDDATELVLLYLESIGNPRKFSRIARRVSRRKPIVAVRSGRATQGVPMGHAVRTIEVPQAAIDEMFRQAGVIQVDTLDEMFDVAQLLAHQPLPAGDRVGIVGNSDAIGLLAADAAVAVGLTLASTHLLGAAATAADFEEALKRAIEDPDVDAVVAVYIPPLADGADDVAQVLASVGARAGKPVLSTFLGSEGIPELLRAPDAAGGSAGRGSVPSFPAVESAMGALALAVEYVRWLDRPDDDTAPPEVDSPGALAHLSRLLVEHPDGGELEGDDVAALLGHYGIAVSTASDEDAAIPVAIGGIEDPFFGPVISFGLAGALPELVGDRAYRIPPLSAFDAASLVRGVKAAPLLLGNDDFPRVAVDAIEDLLRRVSVLKNDLPEVVVVELVADVGPEHLVVVSAGVRIASATEPRTDLLVRRLDEPETTLPN